MARFEVTFEGFSHLAQSVDESLTVNDVEMYIRTESVVIRVDATSSGEAESRARNALTITEYPAPPRNHWGLLAALPGGGVG